MSRKYRYFSADSHYESLPESWTHRVPAKYRDRAPRRLQILVEYSQIGSDLIFFRGGAFDAPQLPLFFRR